MAIDCSDVSLQLESLKINCPDADIPSASPVPISPEPPAIDEMPEAPVVSRRRKLVLASAADLISAGHNVAVRPSFDNNIRVQTYINCWNMVAVQHGLWVRLENEVRVDEECVVIMVG
jgi:hypothetical protein